VLVPGEDGEPDSSVPEYAFRGVRARLTGLELEARAALPLAGLPLAASLTLDGVRGNNRDTGEPLPRLAPLRASATLEADFERWRTGLTVRHAARQNRVPAYDTATPGHTLVDLWAAGRLGNAAAWQWFARLANVGDRLASNASAVSTVRGLTPQGGRALTLGLRWQM
jgi:iron complex outermembrane receptor protein